MIVGFSSFKKKVNLEFKVGTEEDEKKNSTIRTASWNDFAPGRA